MNLSDVYVLYKNSGKYFPTYESAYFNTKKPMTQKQVYYVFTPTMCEYKRVSELENAARQYFNRTCGLDYFDLLTSSGFKQLNLIGEL